MVLPRGRLAPGCARTSGPRLSSGPGVSVPPAGGAVDEAKGAEAAGLGGYGHWQLGQG
jgi:hypothetical protein